MAENLNFKTNNSWCYENKDGNCKSHGRLYDWNAAMGACPSGWRLPTRQDWDNLVQADGGVGNNLKSTSIRWITESCCGDCISTNRLGFSALPSGRRDAGGGFFGVEWIGSWWSAVEHDTDDAYSRNTECSGCSGDMKESNWSKNDGLPIRCVQK